MHGQIAAVRGYSLRLPQCSLQPLSGPELINNKLIGFEKRDHFAHTIKNDFIALIDRANLALHNDTWPKARSPPNPEMRPLLLQPFRGNAIH